MQFLTPGKDGRVGYCEQFAAAFAVMARTLDMPSRVAIGFLAPKQVGHDEWVYSAHDMHAWPEVYFRGSGWVRFEPTPAGRTGTPPVVHHRQRSRSRTTRPVARSTGGGKVTTDPTSAGRGQQGPADLADR